jgi:hypothetical protein
VKGGDDPGSGEASVVEPQQGVQEGLQLGLVLPRNAPPPALPHSSYDPLGIPGQPAIVVAEIELAVLPPLVRRGQGGRDVKVRPIQPQLERTATGPHRSADLLHLRRQREGLRVAEVDP